MIDSFYAMKFPIGCNKVFSGWNHVVNRLFNFFYPYRYHLMLKDGLNHENREERIIVSLASFPARFDVLPLALSSLLNQTLKPDSIILWLAEEQCGSLELPQEIKELTEYGVNIRYAPINLRPHNKLYFTLKENPNCVVITVDDDSVYSPQLIERLYKAHIEHPDCVCCNMAHEITLKDGYPDKYDNWNGGAPGQDGASNYFVAIGVGGVLYPPNCFDREYFDANLIKELALSTDDLWLKVTELRLGIPVYKISKNSKSPFPIKGSQNVALGKENNGGGKNDVNMKKLINHYSFDWEKL